MEKTKPTCTVCGENLIPMSFKCRGQDMFRCPKCHFQRMWIEPHKQSICCNYSQDYFKRWDLDFSEEIVRRAKIRTFDLILNRAEKYAIKGKVLDVGCATGFFLHAAAARGWEVSGLDINPAAIRIARRDWGQRVCLGRFEALNCSSPNYEMIVATDVIEHISRVEEFVMAAKCALKPKGLLVITTVDTQSISCRLMGRMWPHYKIDHVCYFNPSNLQRFLESYGMRVLDRWSTNKALSLGYLLTVLSEENDPFLGRLAIIFRQITPTIFKRLMVVIPCGQFSIIAKRT